MFRRRGLWALLLVACILSLAAAAFAVQAFSGGTREIVVPSTESGALVHLAAADAAAASWHDDAYLTRVLATEGKPIEGRVDPPILYDTTPDPLVGNALAVVWTYAYASPAEPGKLYFVSVGGDGGVLYQRALADPSACCVAYAVSSDGSVVPPRVPEPARLARPTLDAPDAFARVSERPEFAGFAADHPVFQAALHLAPRGEDGAPLWHVMYRTATLYGAYATIDARTGDVLESDSWPQVQPPCCETPPEPPTPTPPHVCCRPGDFSGEFRMTLSPTQSSDQVGFPVESAAWLGSLTVTVAPDAGLLFEEVHVRLTDGQGRPLVRESGASPMTFSFTDVPGEGVYTLQAWTVGPSLRPIPLSVTVDVTYDEQPHALATEHVFKDRLAGWGAATYVPLWFGFDGTATRLALTWTPGLPTDTMELALLDEYGNDIATAQDASGSVELDVPEGRCCLTAIVRNTGRGVMEQPFELLVEVAYQDPVAVEGTIHVHEAHAEHVH